MDTEYDIRYFPKRFYHAATSKGYFPKRHLPKSPLVTAIKPTPVLAAALGPLAHPSRSASEGLT